MRDLEPDPDAGHQSQTVIGRATDVDRVRYRGLVVRVVDTNAEIDALKVRYETLTAREREVFSLVTAGLLNKQVAAELGVAEKTIKQHRGHVVDKMAAQSLADLVLMAERLGVRPTGVDFASARGKLTS